MSIWNINEKNRKVKTLNNNLEVTTLIIGGGMTGLSTAYYLKDKQNIAVVDANYVGHGVTLNSTAKITYFQEGNYTKIKNLVGINYAKKYLKSQQEAILLLKKIITEENIDCDLKKAPSYLFAVTKEEVTSLKTQIKFLKDNNIKIKRNNLPVDIPNLLSYSVNDTYTINPYKYLMSLYNLLNKKIPIYENTKIIKVKQKDNYYYCYTENYIIKAKNVIFACHYPFFLFPLFLPIRSSIEKSYMIVSRVIKDLGFTAINTKNPIYSCRFYQDNGKTYQISLSESHNTALKQNDDEHFEFVKKRFNLKNEDIIMKYSNVDIISHDYMPYIGEIKKNMYISTGYNTWGMTNSVLGAKIISDTILKRKNKYKKVFNPKRKNLALFLKIPLNILFQIKSFFGAKIIKQKPWYSKKVKFFTHNGKSLASYTDDSGKEYIVYNKCPHLGCSLIFNEEEKTWDCPCHSSRFNLEGKCIKGPSLYDISYKRDE